MTVDKGKITIDDVDIENISRDDLRRNIAMVLPGHSSFYRDGP